MLFKSIFRITKKILKNNIYIILSIFILLITFSSFYGSWIIESDSLHYQLLSLDKNFFSVINNFFITDLYQGRATFFGGFWYRLTFLFDNYIYFKLVFYILVGLNCYLLSLLISKIFNYKNIFYFVFVIFAIFLQNTWHANGLLGFSNMFTGMITIFLLSLIFFHKYIISGNKKCLLISVIFYIFSLFTYEIFVIYLPLFPLLIINEIKFFDIKKIFAKSKYLFFSVFFYLVVYLIVKSFTLSSYSGVSIGNGFNISNIAKVLLQFSISSLPLYMLKYDTWSRSFGVFNLLFLNKNLLIIILFWILKFIAVFIIIFSILKSSFNKIKINFLLILIGIFYFFCTPILLAITNHYQSVVLNKIFLSEPITYFSYFYLIFTITVIVFWINNKLQNNIIRNCFVLFVAIMFSIIGLIMDFSNINYNISQTIAKNKWTKVDQFIKTEDFKLIPNGSIIYTTNLSDNVGTLIINEKNYWSDYIKAKTGKDLIIIDTIDSSNSKKYTFKYSN